MKSRHLPVVLRLAFLIFVSIALTGCPWDDLREFHSKIDYRISPSNDTLNIGDTLWLSTSFGNRFEFVEDGSTLRYNDEIDVRMYISIVMPNADPQTGLDMAYATENFTLVRTVGTGANLTLMQPEFTGRRYQLEVGLVANHLGLYLIEAGWGSFYKHGFYLTGRFNVADPHHSLVDTSFRQATYIIRESDYQGITNRTYCFYVK